MKNNNTLDRSRQPEVVIPERVKLLQPEEHTAPNGVRIYSLSAPEYEVIRFSFIFAAGSSWQDAPFCASATINNLAEGSKNATAQQISERLDYYGSYFDVTIDRDWSVVTFVCLTKFFKETMELAREILLEPLFPEAELRVYCDKSRQNLIINRTKVDYNARELFAKSIYGADHPYGNSSDTSMYDKLTREDVVSFYDKFYTAANCFVVLSGNVAPESLVAMKKFVSDMPAGKENIRKEFPAPQSVATAHLPFPKAVQSAIRIGRTLFPRQHPDYIGMQIVATVLGGYFGSRLVKNLREEHGYTYGAYSAMVNFDRSGYFAAATEVGVQFTADAVKQIFTEIERLRNEPVSAGELALVKNIMVGEVMRILDGPFGIADVTIENIQNSIDNDYITRFVEEVRAATPERVMELAAKYLAREELTYVVVGPEL